MPGKVSPADLAAQMRAAAKSGPDRSRPAKAGKLDVPDDLTADQAAFRRRAEAERRNMLIITDSEFWCTLGFATAADLDAFLVVVGIPGDDQLGRRWLDGYLFADRFGIPVDGTEAPTGEPGEPARVGQITPEMMAGAAVAADDVADFFGDEPSLFDDIDYPGDLEGDSYAESAHLMRLFDGVDQPPDAPVEDHAGSPHYAVLVFCTRADKDEFLSRAGLWEHGDKYLDGHTAAERLGVTI